MTCIKEIRTGIGRGVSHPTGILQWTLFQLRNLNPRSIQNTDAVSSINFPNPGISCSTTLLLNPIKIINTHVTYNTGTMR